jgi:hypothetical protein
METGREMRWRSTEKRYAEEVERDGVEKLLEL